MTLTTYDLIITGDRRGAGTDANVSICIFGNSGDSGDVKLENKISQFSKNSMENFSITCGNVGINKKLGSDTMAPE